MNEQSIETKRAVVPLVEGQAQSSHSTHNPYAGPANELIAVRNEEIEQSIPDCFERIVRLYPDRLAIKAGDRSLTYEQLNQAANLIGHAILEKRGKGREPVALLFEHSIDAIPAILGVLKAGKFFVALDASSPAVRNAYILGDSEASLIVTHSQTNTARELGKNASVLVSIDEIDKPFSCENLALALSPDDQASIVYTSGSTGKPKGVIVTHRNVLHSNRLKTELTRIRLDDRLSLLHSLSFTSAHGQLFASLLNGASLFPFDIKREGVDRLARWLEDEAITIYHSPLVVFRELANSLSGEGKFPSLRLIRLGAAPITRQDFELYRSKFSRTTLLYISMGTTEARGTCSAVVDHTFSFPDKGSPAGYPHPGKRVFLLDENGHEVGPGEVGEIAVKGRNLNPGYWKQPEMDRAKFLPDPNGGDERIYLTGDLGRMLPDGFLIHLGRKDSMVKIRGYRVETAEVEGALLSHPGVREAGVTAWDRELGEKYLTAYIVARGEPAPKIDELRGFLKDKLPDYMMPSGFMFLEALPLTNGKLDREALPKPDDKRPELSQPYAPPRSEVEQKLAQIWAEVLSLERIGIHDNFFDLGGHSLLATRVISQVIKKFQLELPLQSLFQSPTVAEMAAVFTEHQGKKLDEEALERVLTELEAMSEEEAKRLLAVRETSNIRLDT